MYLQPSRPCVPPLHRARSLRSVAVMGGEGVFLFVPTEEVFIFTVKILPGRRFFVFVIPGNAFNPVLMERIVYFFGVCDLAPV